MPDKTILKAGPFVGIFTGAPAVTVAGAVAGVLPVVLVAGAAGAGIYLASRCLSSDEHTHQIPQKN